MHMSTLLRHYIATILREMKSNPAVNDELVSCEPKQQTSNKESSTDDESDDVDEMSVVANIAGFTGPLGASSEDLKGPGAGKKTKKKTSARWK